MAQVGSHALDTGSVINAVRQRSLLWDSSDDFYNVKHMRKEAWTEICKELLPEWDTYTQRDKRDFERKIQQRWRTARDCYVKQMTGRRKYDREMKYIYSKQMTFLQPTMRVPVDITARTAPDSPEPQPKVRDKRPRKRLLKFSPEPKGKLPAIAPAPPPPPPLVSAPLLAPPPPQDPHVHTDDSMCTSERQLLASLVAARRSSPLDEDDDNFFKSLAPILAGFTPSQKLKFRSKVLAIAMEIQESSIDAVYFDIRDEPLPQHDDVDDTDEEDPIENKYSPPQELS